MDEKKNEVIKLLNELVAIFKERNTVRKIWQAKDVKAAFEEEKEAMSEQLERFSDEFENEYECPIYDVSEVFSSENVVEICFILWMSGVSDTDLTDNWEDIDPILLQVEGELQEMALRFSDFMYRKYQYFWSYTDDELISTLLM